jgi:hypothetical protein
MRVKLVPKKYKLIVVEAITSTDSSNLSNFLWAVWFSVSLLTFKLHACG